MSTRRGHQDWDSFIKACTTTWSQRIVDSLQSDFSTEDCLFILIDDSEDTKAADNEFPTKNYIENVLSSQTKSQVIHLDVDVNSNKELGEILSRAASHVNAYFAQCLQVFVLKQSVNAISTGAHVLIGKTYENIMIDVKVSNEKLYWRAVAILQKFSNKSANECEQSLLTAIYGSRARAGDTSITLHIENATDQSLVVPKALIMLITGCDHVEASRMLNESQNSVRGCIRKLKSSH